MGAFGHSLLDQSLNPVELDLVHQRPELSVGVAGVASYVPCRRLHGYLDRLVCSGLGTSIRVSALQDWPELM
jgi:hypothetical protein